MFASCISSVSLLALAGFGMFRYDSAYFCCLLVAFVVRRRRPKHFGRWFMMIWRLLIGDGHRVGIGICSISCLSRNYGK